MQHAKLSSRINRPKKSVSAALLRIGSILAVAFLTATPALAHPGVPGGNPTVAPAPSFQRDVAPIMRTACLGCHNADSSAGSFSVASFAMLMKGGKSGQVIVPGKSADSRLVKMILGTVQPKMPPGGGLKQVDIDRVRAWIDSGAKLDTALATPGTAAPATATHATATRPVTHTFGKTIAAAAPITALAYSPDGNTLAVGTYRAVRFWDVKGQRFAGEWTGHADAVRCLVYSKDGGLLAAGGGVPGSSGEIRLWDTHASRETAVFGDDTDVINAVAFSPDAKRIACGSSDKNVEIWEVAGPKQISTLRDHSDAVLGISWSPDSKYIASCSADWSIKVWDPIAAKRLYSVAAHDGAVNTVSFSPDGKTLLSCSADRTAKQWNFAADSSTLLRSLSSHSQYVLCASFSKNGKVAATGSADKTVKVWRTQDGANTATLTDAKDWIYAVSLSPDGSHLAAGCWDGSLLIWTLTDSKLQTRTSSLP